MGLSWTEGSLLSSKTRESRRVVMMAGQAPVSVLVWSSLQHSQLNAPLREEANTSRYRAKTGCERNVGASCKTMSRDTTWQPHGIGSCLVGWVITGTYCFSPSLTKSNKAVRNQAQTDNSQRHTATTTSPRCQGSMGVGVSDPCPAQAAKGVCFDWRRGPLPIISSPPFRARNKGGWEGLEQPSPLTEPAHLSRRFLLADCTTRRNCGPPNLHCFSV